MSSEDSDSASSGLSGASDSELSGPFVDSIFSSGTRNRHRGPWGTRLFAHFARSTNSYTEFRNNSVEVLEPDEEIRSLPCEHQYLGDLCHIRGRVVMDDGSIYRIPLLFPASQLIIVPGQSFPLIENDTSANSTLKYTIQSDHIFGIISLKSLGNSLINVIGTTAEVIAYSVNDGNYTIRAIGRQRFKILSVATERINDDDITFGEVLILPEVGLEPFLEGVRLASLNKFRTSQKYKCLKRDADLTRWPAWVYRSYDEKYLVQEIKRKLARTFLLNKNIVYSDDPSTFSFQLLKNIPISEKLVREAMAFNSPIQRLRWFLKIMNSHTGKLKCSTCRATIGYASDIFAMSAEGAHGTYVNPLGYVHELITLRKVQNVTFSSEMDTNYSWFPGYAWTVLACQSCRYHLGWKFTAQKEHLVPSEFWGIRNSSINVKYQKNGEGSVRRRRIGQRYRNLVTRVD